VRLTTIQRDVYYSNVLLVSKDGRPLSTVSDHKAAWYLSRNLGVEIPPPEGYPRAVKLNFETKDVPRHVHHLVACKSQCVICGVDENLTLHHVVPHVIRKHFPVEHKSKARQWCVLMCYKHHMELESELKPLYYQNTGFPHGITFNDYNLTLQKIKSEGTIYRVPKERLERLLAESDYKTVDDIPQFTKAAQLKRREENTRLHNEQIRQWALKFIKDHGGIEGTKQFFREHFLQSNPQYLPDGWLMDKALT
jgi:hypothetical protein